MRRPPAPQLSFQNSANNLVPYFIDLIPQVWYYDTVTPPVPQQVVVYANGLTTDSQPFQVFCEESSMATNLTVSDPVATEFSFFANTEVIIPCDMKNILMFQSVTAGYSWNTGNLTLTEWGMQAIPLVFLNSNQASFIFSSVSVNLLSLGDMIVNVNNSAYLVLADGTLNDTSVGITVSNISWFTHNTYGSIDDNSDVYQVPWWYRLFYEIGLLGDESFFVYPGSDSWSTYLVDTLVVAAPFFALAAIIFISFLANLNFGSCRNWQLMSCRKKKKKTKNLKQQAKILQHRILSDRQKLEKLMQPSNLKQRYFVAFLLVVLIVVIPVVIIEAGIGFSVMQQLQDGLVETGKVFSSASSASRSSQQTVQQFATCIASQNDTEQVGSLLDTELGILHNYVNLLFPGNFPASGYGLESTAMLYIILVVTLVVAVFCLAIFALSVSMILTFYTCTWGHEIVVCIRVSTVLGTSLPVLLKWTLIAGCLSLAALSFVLSLLSEMCYGPNFIVANPPTANWTSSQQEQVEQDIYYYRYNTSLTGTRQSLPLLGMFNIGAFLATCKSSQVIFNPYSALVMRASTVHSHVLRKVTGTIVGCQAEIELYGAKGFYNSDLAASSCSSFSSFSTAIRDVCTYDREVFGNQISIFLVYVLVIFCTLMLAVTFAFHDILIPSLYRVKRSKILLKVISMNQDELEKVIRVLTGSDISSRNLSDHHEMGM